MEEILKSLEQDVKSVVDDILPWKWRDERSYCIKRYEYLIKRLLATHTAGNNMFAADVHSVYHNESIVTNLRILFSVGNQPVNLSVVCNIQSDEEVAVKLLNSLRNAIDKNEGGRK